MVARRRSVGLVLASALLAFAWSATPAAGGGQPTKPAVELASDPGCFSSGSGATFMKVCVSADGTITAFESPAGSEHINAGVVLEGYRVCQGIVTLSGYDAGDAGESGFGPSTVTQPNGAGTLPLTITRTTSDGVFRLTQTFARDTGERDFRITMMLRNLTNTARHNVSVSRFFDGDIDGDDSDDVYDFSEESVWGRDEHALSLSVLSVAVSHGAQYESYSDLSSNPGSCVPTPFFIPWSPTSPGDWTGLAGNGWMTIPAGASRTAKFVYRAF